MEFLFDLLMGAVVLGFFIFVGWRGSKMYNTLNPGERRDFLIGFFGVIVLNVLLYPLSLALKGDSTLPETRATVSLALPWVVNLALLIFFAFYRRWIALGALALVGFLLAFVILARVLFFLWGVDFPWDVGFPERTTESEYFIGASFALLGILLIGFVVLLIGAVVLGPPILLWRFGSKMLKNVSPPERQDFLIGFLGVILLNVFLYPLSLAFRGDNISSETRATISLSLPWVVNLALLIFFAFYRRWIALGALALVGFLLVWAVLSGVLFYVSCFVLILGGGALSGVVSFLVCFFWGC